ncbi:MAG TPA: hypothetical protein VN420_03070 [Candidatus Fimivivens sp.]|nr:hypothetical protein [Candidatus Fimivivens sp.]
MGFERPHAIGAEPVPDTHDLYDDEGMYYLYEKKRAIETLPFGEADPESVRRAIVAAEALLLQIGCGKIETHPVGIEVPLNRMFDLGHPDETFRSDTLAAIGRCREAISHADHERYEGLVEIERATQELLALAKTLERVNVLQEIVCDWEGLDIDDPESVRDAMNRLLDTLETDGPDGCGPEPDDEGKMPSSKSFAVEAREGMESMLEEVDRPNPESIDRMIGTAKRLRSLAVALVGRTEAPTAA